MKMKLKKWNLVKHFDGFPKDSDLQLVEEEIPELQDGGTPFFLTRIQILEKGFTNMNLMSKK